MQEVRIGFWKSEADKDLPMPQPSTARRDQVKVIRALQAAIDAAAKPNRTSRMLAYKGFSTCRICGRPTGSLELEIVRKRTTYRIPEGYLHYLQAHDVGYDLRLIRALRLEKQP